MDVTGTDVASDMISIARQRVTKGTFLVADMVDYEPEGTFDAISPSTRISGSDIAPSMMRSLGLSRRCGEMVC